MSIRDMSPSAFFEVSLCEGCLLRQNGSPVLHVHATSRQQVFPTSSQGLACFGAKSVGAHQRDMFLWRRNLLTQTMALTVQFELSPP